MIGKIKNMLEDTISTIAFQGKILVLDQYN
jgi:hypothetical protein